MTNKPVTEALKVALADTYTLYLTTQNYHWNVTGPHFKSLHSLFKEQYDDLGAAADDIAERIRTLGEKAPGSFGAFSKLKTLDEAKDNANAPDMIAHLAKAHHLILQSLKTALSAAQKAGDEATADLLIGRIATHEKHSWMLTSSM